MSDTKHSKRVYTKIIVLFFAVITIALSVHNYIYNRSIDTLLKEYPTQNYIAHGGGAIDGYLVTNSLEAIDNAINHGFKYIELDLCLTSDGYIVANRDWETFSEITNFQSDLNCPPTLSEFCQYKIHQLYTPVTYKMIDSIFSAHKDLVLVTDKFDDIRILKSQLPKLSKRILIECFTQTQYDEAIEFGYGLPMHSNDINFQSITVLNESDYNAKPQKIHKRFLPSVYAIYKHGTATKAWADSIFTSDKFVRFAYVDIVE